MYFSLLTFLMELIIDDNKYFINKDMLILFNENFVKNKMVRVLCVLFVCYCY